MKNADVCPVCGDLISPEYHGRKGPGGMDLDCAEAGAWFPDLTLAPVDVAPATLPPGSTALLSYGQTGIRFWVTDVEPSVEYGWYFGNIVMALPENDANLDMLQNVGFTARNVFAVRSSDGRASVRVD